MVSRKAVQKKAQDQKPKRVVVISPDEALKSEEEKPVSARKSGKGLSRKTLTSTLTARSKVISLPDILSVDFMCGPALSSFLTYLVPLPRLLVD